MIVLMVIALNVLNSLGTDGSFGNQDSEHSVLSETARVVTPLFAPMGLRGTTGQRWSGYSRASLRRRSSSARSTICTRISRRRGVSQDDPPFDIVASLREAAATVPANLSVSPMRWLDPVGPGQCE